MKGDDVRKKLSYFRTSAVIGLDGHGVFHVCSGIGI